MEYHDAISLKSRTNSRTNSFITSTWFTTHTWLLTFTGCALKWDVVLPQFKKKITVQSLQVLHSLFLASELWNGYGDSRLTMHTWLQDVHQYGMFYQMLYHLNFSFISKKKMWVSRDNPRIPLALALCVSNGRVTLQKPGNIHKY